MRHATSVLLTSCPVEDALRSTADWDGAAPALHVPVLAACKHMPASSCDYSSSHFQLPSTAMI
jgi:hypothetical protein